MPDFFWTVKIELHSGHVIRISGTALSGQAAETAALAYVVREWNQDIESLDIVGLSRGRRVDFASTKKGVKIFPLG